MYSMSSNSPVEKKAISAVTSYLETLPDTKEVISVENDSAYQKKDVDLIWVTKDGVQSLIEVKGDRYTTGNFAFEIISNQALNTPGCFLYTEANFIFYYFINWQTLYILPMPETKEWFLSVAEKYTLIYPKTVGKGTGKYLYTTVCRLVPIQDVLAVFPEISVIQL